MERPSPWPTTAPMCEERRIAAHEFDAWLNGGWYADNMPIFCR
jgi:hypothetical protein